MSRTANLRRQHDAAVVLVGEIRAFVRDCGPIEDRATAVATRLAKLTGLLRIHFAQEDRTLYPWLMDAPDRPTAAIADAFQREMGQLGATYLAFAERWSSPSRLAADMAAFRTESDAVFAALATRIRRENEQLYSLAEALAAREAALPPPTPEARARAA